MKNTTDQMMTYRAIYHHSNQTTVCPKCGQQPKVKTHDFYSTAMCCGVMTAGDTAQEAKKNWALMRGAK